MPIDYPSNLPLLQRNKSRTETQTFVNADVAAGPPFVQPISYDVSTEWPFTLKMTRGQGVVFQSWLRTADTVAEQPINGGWFNMDVLVEFGLETQEVRFLRQPQIASVEGNYLTYRGQVITRDLNLGFTEDDYELINEIAGLTCNGDYIAGTNLLDVAINIDWP